MPEYDGGVRIVWHTKNICPLFSSLIMQGMCTLRDLEEFYSFGDVLTMAEILSVKHTNEHEFYKKQTQK